MRKLLSTTLVAAGVALFAPSVLAQSSVDDFAPVANSPAPSSNALLGFAVGATSVDVSGINSSLVPDGYRRLDPTLVTLGFWGALPYGRWMFTADAHAFFPESNSLNDRVLETNGGRGFLGVAYSVVDASRFRLFPQLGLGLGGLDLSFSEPPSYVAEMQAMDRDVEHCTNLDFMANTSLGASYAFTSTDGRWAPMMSLQAGYAWSLANSRWYSEGHTLKDVPSFSQTGPFVMLTLGAERGD